MPRGHREHLDLSVKAVLPVKWASYLVGLIIFISSKRPLSPICAYKTLQSMQKRLVLCITESAGVVCSRVCARLYIYDRWRLHFEGGSELRAFVSNFNWAWPTTDVMHQCGNERPVFSPKIKFTSTLLAPSRVQLLPRHFCLPRSKPITIMPHFVILCYFVGLFVCLFVRLFVRKKTVHKV